MEEEINMISLKFIFGLLIFILLLHIIATINSWYWTFTWFDMPMHFLGGFWLAMVFMWLNPNFQIQNPKFIKLPNYLITGIITLGFVILVGVFWEFFEFLCDVFLFGASYFQKGAIDTIKDLFFDLLGGLIFLVIYKYFLKSNDAKSQQNKDYFPE